MTSWVNINQFCNIENHYCCRNDEEDMFVDCASGLLQVNSSTAGLVQAFCTIQKCKSLFTTFI